MEVAPNCRVNWVLTAAFCLLSSSSPRSGKPTSCDWHRFANNTIIPNPISFEVFFKIETIFGKKDVTWVSTTDMYLLLITRVDYYRRTTCIERTAAAELRKRARVRGEISSSQTADMSWDYDYFFLADHYWIMGNSLINYQIEPSFHLLEFLWVFCSSVATEWIYYSSDGGMND